MSIYENTCSRLCISTSGAGTEMVLTTNEMIETRILLRVILGMDNHEA